MRKFFIILTVIGVMFLVPRPSYAIFLVDTGPGDNTATGSSLDFTNFPLFPQWQAGQFTTTEAHTITSLLGWIGSSSTTSGTISAELRAHKWSVQDMRLMPVLDQLTELMDQAYQANQMGDRAAERQHVDAYRAMYAANKDDLK